MISDPAGLVATTGVGMDAIEDVVGQAGVYVVIRVGDVHLGLALQSAKV